MNGNKKLTFVLVAAVIVVWLNFFFRMGNVLKNNDTEVDDTPAEVVQIQVKLDSISFPFQGRHRDPFEPWVKAQQEITIHRPASPPAPQVTRRPDIVVTGIFGSTAVIQYRGGEYYVKAGDVGDWGECTRVEDNMVWISVADSIFHYTTIEKGLLDHE